MKIELNQTKKQIEAPEILKNETISMFANRVAREFLIPIVEKNCAIIDFNMKTKEFTLHIFDPDGLADILRVFDLVGGLEWCVENHLVEPYFAIAGDDVQFRELAGRFQKIAVALANLADEIEAVHKTP